MDCTINMMLCKVKILVLVISSFDFAWSFLGREYSITKCDISFNPEWVNLTSVFKTTKNNVTVQDLYIEHLMDVTDKTVLNLLVETMDQNGIYSPSQFKFKNDLCKVLGKNLASQNPFVQALFMMLRKTAKFPFSCPIKKGLYYVKNIKVDPRIVPPLPSKNFKFNLELLVGQSQMKFYSCQWYMEGV